MSDTQTKFAQQLELLDACSGARKWVGNSTLEDAWATCERGDWLLWLAARVRVDIKTLTLAKCACARLALKHVPAGEERPRIAVETAERWARREATDQELDVARRTAAAADAADAAYDAAAYADAAAADAYDAAYDADAAYAAARYRTLSECAVLVRGIITVDMVKEAMENV